MIDSRIWNTMFCTGVKIKIKIIVIVKKIQKCE